jgi:hypothetical protein
MPATSPEWGVVVGVMQVDWRSERRPGSYLSQWLRRLTRGRFDLELSTAVPMLAKRLVPARHSSRTLRAVFPIRTVRRHFSPRLRSTFGGNPFGWCSVIYDANHPPGLQFS